MMTTHTQLSIIVPCYNEEQRIAHTISKLLPAVDKLNISYEIILVNDGSVDDTHTIIKDLAHNNSNITVLSYHNNRGKGYAVKCGIKKSQGEYYLIMDADLATDISELKKFWSKRTTADCLIGNRKNEHNQRNVIRDIAGSISHGLVNTVLNLKLKDTQCGFKLLSSKTKNMWSHVHSERRGFDFELLYLLQKNGYSIKEIDVKRNDIAGSKVTFSSYLTTWKELRNTSRLHNIKTLDRINQFAVSTLAVMGIVLYGVVNVAQAQNETTTITECVSYDSSSYNSNIEYPTPAEACGEAAGQVTTSQFPVGGLCRTGTPFLQNFTFIPKTSSEAPVKFDAFSQVDGTISSITPTPNGQYIIIGKFTRYAEKPANGIALVNADGSLNTKFDTSKLNFNSISAAAVQPDGSIFIAGSSTVIDEKSGESSTTSTIIKLNPDGSLDTKFNTDGKFNSIVKLAVNSDGSIFIVNSAVKGSEFEIKINSINNDKEIENIIKLVNDITGLGLLESEKLISTLPATIQLSQIDQAKAEGIQKAFTEWNVDTTLVVPNANNNNSIIKLNPDGSLDTKFDASAIKFDNITAITIQADGSILVAGSNTIVDEKSGQSTISSSIFRFNPDGSLDTKFDASAIKFDNITAITIQADGSILVAGSNTIVDEKSGEFTITSSIVRLNPDGSLDTRFNTEKGFNGPIYSISIDKNNRIIVIGNFTAYNGQEIQNIAVLNTDGSLDTSIQDEMLIYQYTWSCIDTVVNYNSNGSASATSFDSNGSATSSSNLGICGSSAEQSFTSMPTTNLCDPNSNNGGVTRTDNVATDGTYNWTCGINQYTYTAVSCTAYSSNGSATSYNSNGSATSYNSNGSATSYNSNTLAYCNSFDRTNYNYNNYTPYSPLCGDASGGETDGFPIVNLCAAGITPFLQNIQIGNLDNTFVNNIFSSIDSSVVQPDGKIIVAGYSINGDYRITRLNIDGSLDNSFNSAIVDDAVGINTIVLQPDGKIIVSGSFSAVNGVGGNSTIARLNPDGSFDNSFNRDYYNAIYGMVGQPDGKILISTNGGIIRLNTDGFVDTSFNAENTSYDVRKMILQPDGKILIGGRYYVSGVEKYQIARMNTDGSLDMSFVVDANGLVYSIALQPDGKILIGGGFDLVNNTIQRHIARFNTDGSLDNSFNTADPNGDVNNIEVQSDGKILIGGGFNVINGSTRKNIARLNTNGSLDVSFNINLNNGLSFIKVQPDGKILIGGGFGIVNGTTRQSIARLNQNAGLEQYTWACLNPDGNYNSNGTASSYNSYGSATSYNSNGSATSYNSNGSATSYNSNGSATSYNSNGSATSYNSNGSATSYNSNGSATSYNSNGSATSYNSNGSATSYNSNGSATSSYNSNLGRCGTASGGTFMSMPTTNLCDLTTNNTTTTTYDVTAEDGTYNWTCGIDHYTYSSASCSAYRSSNGVCGTAQGGLTNTFPSTNLCAEGTPYLQQVQSGSLVIYTWSCIGVGTGTSLANCTSYQNPQTDVCVPYRETLREDSTRPLNISNVLLPGTKVALMLDYDFENGNFSQVSNQVENEDGVTVGSSGSTDYTDGNTYSLTGIINSNYALRVTFNNLNTRATTTNNTSTTGRYRNVLGRYSTGTTIGDTKGQFIQYRQPSSISARTRTSTLRNRTNGTIRQVQDTIIGSNWYGCSADGWNVSLRGLVSDYLLNQIEGVSTTTNTDGTTSTTAVNIPLSPQDWLSYEDIDEDTNEETFNVYIESLNSYININDPEERFLLWDQSNEGFRVDCDVCSIVAPVTTQTGSCVDLPDHAIPNIATEITQYTGADGWFPSTDYTYNTTLSTTDCTFVCENNYSRVDGECKPNTNTQSCVGAMPQYAVLTVPGANTYTSTWNGSGWTPSIRTYTYNPTVYSDPALNACNYTCGANYNRNGGACIPATTGSTCGGTLPANATVTNGTIFTQTRNGVTWTPPIRVYTYGYGTCGFLCNANYTRNSTTLTCNPNTQTVACNGVQPANTNPTNGTTYTQTRNGTAWAPTVSWALGATGSCGYTCQEGYTRNGTICEQIPNTNFTYGRYTGDWSTCTTDTGTVINTGTVITGTYSRDIGEWGACSLAGGTCDGFYPAAGTGGTCSNTMNTVGGIGFSLNFGFTAACLTMDITYNVGRGGDHNSASQGATDYGNAGACAAHGTEGTCSADAGNNCRWFPYANYGLITTTNGSTSTTPLTTCNAAQNQSACAGETINVPGNEWGGIPYSYISGGINGCYWNADPVMRTCNDVDNEFSCELFRPGCNWNPSTSGASQSRSVVCRSQLGNIVPDSYCTQPKPDTTQAGVCNVFANGTCGSALGTPSVNVPTTNLCSAGYAPAIPTVLTNVNTGDPMWFWSCQGTAGGTYSFCSAPKVTGNTYTCQNNGNWSAAGASCDENTPAVNTVYGNTPGNVVCSTTPPQSCLCTANQIEPTCRSAAGGL